jgi:methylmalonyl-CoA mutase
VRPAPDLSLLRGAAGQRVRGARRASPALTAIAADWRDAAAPAAMVGKVVEAAEMGASLGELATALGFHAEPITLPPLAPHMFARPFEELRDASDAWLATHGKRPSVFLANMGPASHHTARASFSKNFFEAGGFEVIGNNGFKDADTAARAFAASGATIGVICSSDKLYPEVVPEIAPKLKAAGARSVVLAGNPGANEVAWRSAGVDCFIFIKCDVLATLRDMLREQGVVSGE